MTILLSKKVRALMMGFLMVFGGTTPVASSSLYHYADPIVDSKNGVSTEQKLICSTTYFSRYRDWAVRLPGDKLKHCALSCVVARRCPHWEVEMVGILKEIFDLFGPGNAEPSDHLANRRGIRFSRDTKTDRDCVRFCRQVY